MSMDKELALKNVLLERAIDIIDDMVNQHCTFSDKSGELDSGFLSSDAEAMTFLVEMGILEYVRPSYGRSVLCRRVKK